MASWRFIGRTDEKNRLIAAATSGPGQGLIVSGSAGIGKSRLLRESITAIPTSDYQVHLVTANVAGARLPLSTLAPVLPEPPAGLSLTGLMRWAIQSLHRAAAGLSLVFAVDDLHLLDTASAALLHVLVRDGATLLGTLRSGETAPAPISALWTEGLVEHAELSPLTRAQSQDLLADMLGGPLETTSARRLTHLGDGNPLLLRELVLAATSGGEMVRTFGLWRWTGQLTLAPTLAGLVDARVGTLPTGVREVVELVALGEPVGLPLLLRAAAPADVEAAEEWGLIRVIADGRRQNVRLAHPLYGEIVRRRCPGVRSRRLFATLADLLHGTGARRRDDLLRLAVWRLDSGTAQDGGMLLEAAGQAFGRFDLHLARRLAEAAHDTGGGFPAVELLATVLAFGDQPERALQVLDQAADETSSAELLGRRLTVRAMVAFSGLGDPAAVDRLADAAREVTDPAASARMRAYEALMRLQRMQCASARELATGVLAEPTARAPARAMARCVLAFLATARGDLTGGAELLAMVDADPDEWRRDSPSLQYAVEMVRGTWVGVALDLDGMDAIVAADFADLAHAGDFGFGSGYASMVQAHAALLRGQTGDALRASEQACAALQDGRVYDGYAHASRARAAALRGDAELAASCMQVVDRRSDSCIKLLYPWREQTRAWVSAAAGDVPAAVAHLSRLADRLRHDDFTGNELLVRYDLVRLGRAELAVDRMTQLVGTVVNGSVAPLLLRHARAAADHCGKDLLAVGRQLVDRGLAVFAVEATADAVRLLRADRDPATLAATTQLGDVLARCDVLRTPMLLSGQPALTTRERQVAELAAQGVRSREIADQLFLSTRTVENHLQHVYAKLGVTGRSELAPALRTLPRDRGEPPDGPGS